MSKQILNPLKEFRKQLRSAIADYMESEGCDCCRDIKAHKVHKERLAKLLFVPRYSDGDGFDFPKFRTKTNK